MVPVSKPESDSARILLVEDDVLVRSVLADELRDAGFTVIEAAHAAEALSYLDAGAAVDMVFTDIQMPGPVDGLELARIVRRDYPTLAIILTSGNVGPEEAEQVGFFIAKPYDVGRAVTIVLGILGPQPSGVPS